MSLPLVRKPVSANNGGEFQGISDFNLGKNKAINGRFDFWQRGTSGFIGNTTSTTTQYMADRWRCVSVPNGGTAPTVGQARQSFALGQTEVPGNPAFYMRITNSGVGTSLGTNSSHNIDQPIESVDTLAGKTVTVSFYARSSISNKSLGVTLHQEFGSGGSTSQMATGAQIVTLTANWAKYSVTMQLPSVLGKTLGSNHNLRVRFSFQMGSAEAANWGLPAFGWEGAGNTDIANVMVNEGAVAGDYEYAAGDYNSELMFCYRYYERENGGHRYAGYVEPNLQVHNTYHWKAVKRTVPTVSISKNNVTNASLGVTITNNTPHAVTWFVSADNGNVHYSSFDLTDLIGDAEL